MMLLSLAVALAEPSDLEAIWRAEVARAPVESFLVYAGHADPQVRRRAALALGRLRSDDARGELTLLLDDADPSVRAAAAFGLGLTPGGDRPLRADWASETDEQVREALIAALGLHADGQDLPTFLAALDGPRGTSRAAAVALGRLGIAEVEGVQDPATLAALTGQLDRLLPEARHGAAFALARIGASEADPATRARLLHLVRTDRDPVVRAWLVRSLADGAEGEEAVALLAASASDADRDVRIAAARALAQLDAAEHPDVLAVLLEDTSWGVVFEAIAAASASDELDHNLMLDKLLQHSEPSIVAATIAALGAAGALEDERAYLADDSPLAWQAAVIGSLDDTDRLIRLALESAYPRLRTAAAGRLLELEPSAEEGKALLAARDAAVEAVGASILVEDPSPEAMDVLLDAMEGSGDLDLWREGLSALGAILSAEGGVTDPRLDAIIARGIVHPDVSVRRRAAEPAALLDFPDVEPPVLDGLPSLADISPLRVARVFTEVGELRVELLPELAPLTVWNFAHLAERDYFDGLEVHRVVPDFVVQDGCPRGDGWGGPGWSIPDELSPTPYEAGTVGMALSGPDTGGSQWFVTLSPQPHLDAGYTVFGQLVQGHGVAQRIRPGTRILDVVIERVP